MSGRVSVPLTIIYHFLNVCLFLITQRLQLVGRLGSRKPVRHKSWMTLYFIFADGKGAFVNGLRHISSLYSWTTWYMCICCTGRGSLVSRAMQKSFARVPRNIWKINLSYSRPLRSAAVDLRSQTEFVMTSDTYCIASFSLDKSVGTFSTQFESL